MVYQISNVIIDTLRRQSLVESDKYSTEDCMNPMFDLIAPFCVEISLVVD
jgi:hypothetical protein